MTAHAEHAYPEECCGLLLGTLTVETASESRAVQEIWSATNVWSPTVEAETGFPSAGSSDFSKTERYWIDPRELLEVQRYARDRGLNIIGVYHSHPDHAAVPSECDRAYAWPQYSYLIVSVQQGQAQDYRSWSLDDQHQFQSEEIITTEFQRRDAPQVIFP